MRNHSRLLLLSLQETRSKRRKKEDRRNEKPKPFLTSRRFRKVKRQQALFLMQREQNEEIFSWSGLFFLIPFFFVSL